MILCALVHLSTSAKYHTNIYGKNVQQVMQVMQTKRKIGVHVPYEFRLYSVRLTKCPRTLSTLFVSVIGFALHETMPYACCASLWDFQCGSLGFPNSFLWVFPSVGVHGEHSHLTKFQTKSK